MTVVREGVKQPGTSIIFDEEEAQANENLLAVMRQIQDWELNCNQDELVQHVHGLQLFLIKHMLQRLTPDDIEWSKWYGKEDA